MTQTEASPTAAQDDGPDPRRWKALAVCLISSFMTLLDISIVNVALPSIKTGLGASSTDQTWIVSGYALAFGLLLVPSGRLGDARGRRQVFITGLVLFVLASTVCGLAPNPTVLVLARLAQGLAGGLLTPQVAGLIQQLFRGAERARAFGLLGATIGVATAIGPLLGGALIAIFGTESGWRGVFFVNLPIGIAAVLLARVFIPAVDTDDRERDYDPVGVVLLAGSVLLLLLPFVQDTLTGARKAELLSGAAVLLFAFVLWERRYERRGKEPTVALELFKERSYALGSGLALLYFAGFTGVFFIYTLHLQQGLGMSALLAGLAITPFAIGSVGGSTVGGRAVDRLGRPLVTAGLLLVLVGLGVTWVVADLVHGRTIAWAAALPLLVAGFGSGLVIAPNQNITLSEVPVARGGSAAGVLQTGQRVGSAMGIAFIGDVFFAHFAPDPVRSAAALRGGLLVTLGFVALALAVGVADLVTTHRREAAARG